MAAPPREHADQGEKAGENKAKAAVGARLDVLLARKVFMKLAGRHVAVVRMPLGALKSLIANAKSIGDRPKNLLGRRGVEAVSEQCRQRPAPDSGGALEAQPVATTQHDPGFQRQRRTNGIGQFLASRLAQGGELRGERFKSGLPQLVLRGHAALGERRMIDELPGGDAQRHDLVEDLRQIVDDRSNAIRGARLYLGSRYGACACCRKVDQK